MFDTPLTPQEEQQYQSWFALQKQLGNILPQDTGEDYDFRGAFKQGVQGQYVPAHNQVHWTDQFKKPNHPSFSTESIYAQDPKYAPFAGQWASPNTSQEQWIPPQQTFSPVLNNLQKLLY